MKHSFFFIRADRQVQTYGVIAGQTTSLQTIARGMYLVEAQPQFNDPISPEIKIFCSTNRGFSPFSELDSGPYSCGGFTGFVASTYESRLVYIPETRMYYARSYHDNARLIMTQVEYPCE